MNPHQWPVHLLRLGLAVTVLAAWAGVARADIVTLGLNPTPLPNCPDPTLPGKCAVDTQAQVRDVVGNLSAVRIGQGGQGGLLVGDNATLLVNRLDLASGVPWVPDVVVGDNVGSFGSLVVKGSGRLAIDVPVTEPFRGGLVIGPFVAPAGSSGPSTTVSILDGGQISVTKPGGVGIGSAVFVGMGAGSHSSLVLDGGIGGFGNQALGARLDTTGNLSIGRLGQGDVGLTRNADLSAALIVMSTVREAPNPNLPGDQVSGRSSLAVGHNSSVTAQGILAGIGLGGPNGYDENSPNHGSAVISTSGTGFINAPIVLGKGGTLMGTGTVGPLVTNFGGTIRPGFSPGTLHILGDFRDVGGTIEIEIGPNGAADFIDVMGDLALAGNLSLDGTTIEFKFIDGFAPTAGFRYDFMEADGLVELVNVSYRFSGLQPGFEFRVPDPLAGVLSFVAINNGVAVPEPGVPALLAAAALAAGMVRRRRLAR